MQMTHTQFIRRPAPMTRRGTSLIEILVVLVILVIGILSIVRLFPAGFIALRNAQNNTFADRLAQGALESLKKNDAGLPDGIYMYSDADGFIPSYAPDDFSDYPKTGTADAAYSDINKQRYISNETITVPSSHIVNGSSFPPLYTLQFGPIFLPSDYTNSTPPAISVHYLHVTSTPWTAQTGDSRLNPSDPSRSIDNPTDILQSNTQTVMVSGTSTQALEPAMPKYLVDEGAGALAMPQATYDQTFVVEIGLPGGGPAQSYTITVLATVPPTPTTTGSGYDGNWFSRSVNNTNVTGGSVLPAGPWTSVSVYRPYFFMGTSNSPLTNSFTADPYEFVVFDSNIAGTDANPGVLAFNPLASRQAGAQSLKARISYMALDWHILHEDHNVAAGSPTIRLTLGHLKKIGDVQFDQSLYNGLVSKTNATTNATTPADIMLLDLDTGAETFLAAPASGASGGNTFNLDDQTGNGTNTTAGTGQYQVTYQNGRITFPDGSPDQNVRVYYAGDADWALAIQKAPSAYILGNLTTIKETSSVSGLMPNQYVIDTSEQRVYFPICDEGKTVEFDGIHYMVGGVARVIGEGTAAISTDLDATNGLPYVNLTSAGLEPSNILPTNDTPDSGSLSFQAVRGISARAVVIWHEHNNWRTRTIDTLLTQPQ